MPALLDYDVLAIIIAHLDLDSLKVTSLASSSIHQLAFPYLRQAVRIKSSGEYDANTFISNAVEFMSRPNRVAYIRRVNVHFPGWGRFREIKAYRTWRAIAGHLITGLERLHALESLQVTLETHDTAFISALNLATLSPTLRSFHTNIGNLRVFLEHHPQIEELSFARFAMISPRAGPLVMPNLRSLKVLVPSDWKLFLHSPALRDLSTYLIAKVNPIAAIMAMSSTLIERLCIDTMTSVMSSAGVYDEILLETIYTRHISCFTSLRYLSITHGDSTLLLMAPSAREGVFGVLCGLTALEELAWLGDVDDTLQMAFFEACAPGCRVLRRVTMQRVLSAEGGDENARLTRKTRTTVRERKGKAEGEIGRWAVVKELLQSVSVSAGDDEDDEEVHSV